MHAGTFRIFSEFRAGQRTSVLTGVPAWKLRGTFPRSRQICLARVTNPNGSSSQLDLPLSGTLWMPTLYARFTSRLHKFCTTARCWNAIHPKTLIFLRIAKRLRLRRSSVFFLSEYFPARDIFFTFANILCSVRIFDTNDRISVAAPFINLKSIFDDG